MKKLILAFAFTVSFMGFAEAQTSRNPCYTTGAQTTQGIPNCIGVGTATPLPVTTTTTPGSPLDIEGNVADYATDSGNSVKVGGVINTTSPTAGVTGQRIPVWMGARGSVATFLGAPSGNPTVNVTTPNGDGQSSGLAGLQTTSYNYLFNGATYDRLNSCPNSAVINVTNGTTAQIVALVAAQRVRVCSITLTSTAATTATVSYGTGALCATGNTALTGAINIATAPVVVGSSFGTLFQSASANALCIAAGAVTVTGFLTYAQY